MPLWQRVSTWLRIAHCFISFVFTLSRDFRLGHTSVSTECFVERALGVSRILTMLPHNISGFFSFCPFLLFSFLPKGYKRLRDALLLLIFQMNDFKDDDDFMPSRPKQRAEGFALQRHLTSLLTTAIAFWEQHSIDGKYVWNKETWSSVIERVVQSTKPSSLNDCWLMPNTRQDKDGYPMIKVTHFTYIFSAQQGTRKTKVEGTAQFETRVYRLLYALLHPDEATLLAQGKREHQCAHRCKHKPQLCVNPHHLVLLDDAANKDMDKCWNGLRALCPHNPPCIFTDKQGKLLPCRNSPNVVQCSCVPTCYKLE